MKNALYSLVALGFVALLVFAVWYLARRSAFAFGTRALWWYVGYGVALAVALASMMVAASAWTVNAPAHLLVVVGGVLTGFLMYLLLTTLIVDLVQLFAHLPRALFGGIVGTVAVGLTVFSLVTAFSPKLVEVDVQLPKLQRPLRAVQLTDTHFGHYRGKRHARKLVELVNSAHPDIIFFTGDCFESWYDFSAETITPFRDLCAPVFFVDGNHDTYVNARQAKELLRQMGVKVLENESVEYAGLQIIGLDYMVADNNARDDMHAALGNETIQSAMQKIDISEPLPTVVLHHSPMGANYMEEAGADLFLAGHTHGGQLWPVTWINDRSFQFNRGLHRLNTLQIYTSCGSGTFGPPMRLGTVSEVTVLDLRPCHPNAHSLALRTAIERQLATYPESTLQDIYKNFYQEHFGPGHIISDTASARRFLMNELSENDCASPVYYEPTGIEGRYVRVYLSTVKDSLIDAEQLLEAFIKSANFQHPQDDDWVSEWKDIVNTIQEYKIQVNGFEQDTSKLNEAAQNAQAVHHSRAYNEAYHPHYRIVERDVFFRIFAQPMK